MSVVTGVTLNKIVYDILSLRKGLLSDDETLDFRQVEWWVQNMRAYLIRIEFNKNRSLSENIVQDLGCDEIETADRAECCDIQVGCSIKRTVLEIPKPIELQQKDAILRVGPIDKMSPSFSYVTYEQAIFSGNGRFNKYLTFAFYRNGRIYLKFSNHNLGNIARKYINIRGLFENPKQAAIFSTCDGIACYTDDSPYPVSNWMIEYMKTQIITTNFKTLYTLPGTDPVNDASGVTQVAGTQGQGTKIS